MKILHEGKDFVAVLKPPGIFVHKTKLDASQPALAALLRQQFERRVHCVHRLDRPVSGILLVAFDSATTARLQRALASEDSIKEYLALVRGQPARRFACREELRAVHGKLQEAHTSFRLLRRFPWCSLVAARLHSGRRHQIRRHCDRLQHQILGDGSHGKSRLNALYRERYGLQRIFLHGRRLCLPSENLDLRCRLPEELQLVLAGLQRDARSMA